MLPFPYDGLTDIEEGKEHHMMIFTELNTRNGLITLIHEALHAENWTANEKDVERVSREIGGFLWRLGFRLKH